MPACGHLTDDDIEAVFDRMDGYICPECGANDWLAEERAGDYIRVRCDDCCRYWGLVRTPEAPR
jgi:hypothetical protein